jgi:hypothetical protein
MTVSLGGVLLNDDLYLDGIENAKKLAVTRYTHLAGTSTTVAMPLSGGRTLTLMTTSSPLQGIWCQSQVDQIKAIEGTGAQVTLTYRDRGNFEVIISGTNFKQFNKRESVNPNKKYTGSVTTVEV